MELKHPSGYILCAITDDENAAQDAINYCKANGYSNKQVEIVRTNGVVLVRVK
jgi:TusA-related sulfurtransferase